jgi:hypothetical protein
MAGNERRSKGEYHLINMQHGQEAAGLVGAVRPPDPKQKGKHGRQIIKQRKG